jgi:hypothetical protein
MEMTAKKAFVGDLEESLKGTLNCDRMPPERMIDRLWAEAPEAVKDFYKEPINASAPPDCPPLGFRDECKKYHDCPDWRNCVGSFIESSAARWSCNI